jgi:hypothetical protein
MTARLESDEAEADPSGNSFSLEMALDIDEPQQLGMAQWHYQAASAERQETTAGIFFDGGKVQLQPLDVTAEFPPQGDQVIVSLSGKFLLFAEDAAAQTVTVSARIPALMEVKAQ